MITQSLTIRQLGQQEYHSCWQAMQNFTSTRDENSIDEVWLLEHFPVFTQGQNGQAQHILKTTDIPIVQSDRGGQVTYHGPGQLMLYTLIDLKRRKLNVREYVSLLEQSIIDLLTTHSITATAKREAPGVYVADKKICSIGLRVRRGCTYHGLAFNITTDLTPFTQINPCGFQGLEMTTLSAQAGPSDLSLVGQQLTHYFIKNLGYTHVQWQ